MNHIAKKTTLLAAAVLLSACAATDVKYRKADELAQVREVCVVDYYKKTGVDVAQALVGSFKKQGVKARVVDSISDRSCHLLVKGEVRMMQGLLRRSKFNLMTVDEQGRREAWSTAVYMLRGEEKAKAEAGGLSVQTDTVVSLLLNKQPK